MKLEEFVEGQWKTFKEGEIFFVTKNREEHLKKLFYYWISQHPESHHPLDIERFYDLTKDFISYKRKGKNSLWLKEQINLYNKHALSNDQIEYYCQIFDHLIDFHNFKQQ